MPHHLRKHEAALALCVQDGLLAEATAFRDANIVDVESYDDLKAAIEAGKWARGRWAGVLPATDYVKE